MSEQYIKRSPKGKENPYRMINRHVMEDTRLSFEARGALAYILVKPDNWQVSVTNLMKEGGIGRDKAYRIINEWIEHGYCERIEHRVKGRITGYEYYIHEEPVTAEPLTEKPFTAEPLTVNTYHNKEEDTNKEEEESASHRTPTARPKDLFFERMCWIVGVDWKTCSNEKKGELNQAKGILTKAGYTADDLVMFWESVWKKDYRWRDKKSRPTVSQLRSEIGKVKVTDVILNSEPNDNLPEYDAQVWDTSRIDF